MFELNRAGVNWPRAVLFLDVALVPLLVFWAIGYEQYLLSALFGMLFVALADPGGGYGYRASHVSFFALIGAGVTALAFGIGGEAWGWLALAAFGVTLVAGLAVAFGVRRFVNALLLNSTSGSSSPSDSRSPSTITPTFPATPGHRCWRGPEGRRCGSC
ncbi:hypothetical protein NMG29_25820 [Streptomyces cocklensis]|uniref:hypothetical protein n=1 Tax=Actinacidiphila cocklensis TaxID=887465 RepID=UPI00203A49D8|nr:hypothetical protein [Actinacidiphila cocklensis]MDD1061594.1 hypothetical protein [Actinacidiphila cocklensis]